MKRMKIFAVAAVLIASLSAFKAQKKGALLYRGYYSTGLHEPCIFGQIDTGVDCTTIGWGALCTINGYPAYSDPSGCTWFGNPNPYALYEEF